ncbi:YeiH family protein [Pinibacter soli]|uniref:Sulfate exporter family transporter n=1 Tax=Pinibacter soli TaxID=3044211 RepID=A0ABT6RDK3_9BACT|nr:putative sulfate exporter family transporter [Pinibacter soli]MDI3320649.1 putative sulfate exporter family transporter [Pinibacter soli]
MSNETINSNILSPELSISAPAKRNILKGLHEDVWAVIIAGLLVTGILTSAFLSPDFHFKTPVFQWSNSQELLTKVLSFNNLFLLVIIAAVFCSLSSIAILFSVGNVRRYITGFLFIYLLALVSLVVSGNKTISFYGIEYVVFGLMLGLLLGNLTKLPDWIKEAARSEFFIKTGLVILGTSILFTDIIKAGLPGILQAIFVVAAVWFFALWLSRKLKVDDEFGVILASAVSICGVSAAIVACGAIGGDKKKLSYVTTLVLLVAIPMLIFMPWIIRETGISEVVGGAWLGGTLDTTASVTAASELVGPTATKAGVIIKFSQNVLIGVAAFFIAGWWVWRKTAGVNENAEKPSLKLVWERFPKFVIGFIAASLLFSFIIPIEAGKQVSGIFSSLRTIWFALAFVSIGLEARFSDLYKMDGGRPALAFIGAQLFNILWTLLWAWLLFGGVLLPAPDIQ